MNYRHAYHAGNFADVLKHAVFALVLEHLKKKDAAFGVLDTHAGIGRYDFWKTAAVKTFEYKDGIERLLAAKPPKPIAALLAPYLASVRALNPARGPLRFYPGSPRLARALIRPQDRLVLAELHPEDHSQLKAGFSGDAQTAIHHTDGYQALKAFLPPAQKRGVALIDPPFEVRDEFENLAKALIAAHKRWPGGTLIAWHPIKTRAPVDAFHAALRDAQLPSVLCAEILVRPIESLDRLAGNGLVLINPPWKLDEQLKELLPFLHQTLAQEPGGSQRLEWLTPPD